MRIRLIGAALALLLTAGAAQAVSWDSKDALGPVVDNSRSSAYCTAPFSLTYFSFYTSSRYYPTHTLDVFLFLAASEGAPEDYAIRADVETKDLALALSSCQAANCRDGQQTQRFTGLSRTSLAVESAPFAAISYEEYVQRAQAAGLAVRADQYAAYGHVRRDLGAAGGESTVRNKLALVSCGTNGCGVTDSCTGATRTPVNWYESQKAVKALQVVGVPRENCGNGVDENSDGQTNETCRGPDVGRGPLPGGSGGRSGAGGGGGDGPTCNISNSEDTGSSCQLASGAFSDALDLIRFVGGPLPLGLVAHYSSLNPTVGPLGRGWAHSYLTRLLPSTGLTVALVDPYGSSRVYQQHGVDTYYPQVRSGPRDRLVKAADGTYTRHVPDGARWRFDATGRLLTVDDRNGQAVTLTYTGSELTRLEDPSGHWITFTYDPTTGRLVQLDDSAGRTVSFGYTGDALTVLVDAAGGSWGFTYDAAGRLATKTDPRQATWTYGYDAAGRLATVTDPAQITRQFVYDPATSTTRVVEPDQATRIQTWNGTLNVPTAVTDPSGRTTTYTYDRVGNVLTRTDGANQTWTYTYDAEGRTLTATDPLQRTTTYTYDPATGLVATQRDPDQSLTQFFYDATSNLTRVVDPTGRETRYGYDPAGRLTTITDPANQVTTFTYNAQHQVTSVTDPTNITTSFTYDAVGRLATMTEPGGATTTYAYDPLNRRLSVTDPLTHTTSTGYDGRGHVTSQTDALGRVTALVYDARGLLTTTTDPASDVTTHGYDSRRRLTSLMDAESRTTTWTHDAAGRVLTETSPLADVTRYQYDARGLVQFVTTPRGHVLERRYDAAGRLTERLGPGGLTESYTYDANGRLATASGGGVAYTLAYDGAGRVTSVTDSRGYTVGYTYDAAGRRQTLAYPGGAVVTVGYDLAGRLVSVTDGPRVATVGYDGRGRRATVTFPNGTRATYTYDLASRLTGITHTTSGGASLQSFTYGLNAADSRTSLTTLDQALGFGYDPANRLTTISAAPGAPVPPEAFTYDRVGNRLTGPNAADTSTYNAGHQILTGPGVTYTYDASGNRATSTDATGTTTYTWDALERLTQAVVTTANGTTTLSFAYDALGQRITRTVVAAPSAGPVVTITTAYVYDGEDILLFVETSDATGTPVTATTRFVHGPGIDEPWLMETGGQVFAVHADGLGSVTGLSDASQTPVEIRAYSAFGQMQRGGSVPSLAYAYTGREWEPELGLYYYRARYYDPEAGRFVSRDPIGFAGGDTNVYAYVRNRPLDDTDPAGLNPVAQACAQNPAVCAAGAGAAMAAAPAVVAFGAMAMLLCGDTATWEPSVPPDRINRCNAAFGRCRDRNPLNVDWVQLCARALRECVTHTLIVKFPHGEWVR